jgi:hypothetical protein
LNTSQVLVRGLLRLALLLVLWHIHAISTIHAQGVYNTTQTPSRLPDVTAPSSGAPEAAGTNGAWQDEGGLLSSQDRAVCISSPLFSSELKLEWAKSSPLSYLWQNLEIEAGLDGSHGPEDLGINANMGVRGGIETAFPIVESWGIGLQIGTSINYHENATRFIRIEGGPGDSTQNFSTIGLFQRTDYGLSWGVAYDYLVYDGFADFSIAQWRGQVGYQWDSANEIGVWGAYRDRGDTASFAGETFSLRSINQASVFWSHIWPTRVMTEAWVGIAESHGDVILGVPGTGVSEHPVLFGARVHIPLNENLAIIGEASFITPYDSGTVTAFLGVAFYPGGNASDVLRNLFSPLFSLANNTNFALDVRR